FRVSPVNKTEDGHKLHSLAVDSLVQYVSGMVYNNPMQWDLSKAFLFVVDDTGGVRLVHCHPEDHEELLVIKKAMIEESAKEWSYTAEEADHFDFPVIEASATTTVNFDGKRPISSPTVVFHNLLPQTLETKPKQEKHTLAAVRQNITKIFDCIRRHPEKDDLNRSLCVNDLRDILHKLHAEEYRQFVGSLLDNDCQGNDTFCRDRRLILIDVIAGLGDATSQELLMTYVLSKRPAVDEELRRVFLHCVAMERPMKSFVKAIERFCFGPGGEQHGSRNMTRTQSRACLAVGSLTRNLAKAGRHTLANTLAHRLETWLDEHGKGDHEISKRDTWLTDTEHKDHHLSKAVLLHALGNAALTRSRRHLLDHAQPNKGHHVWRRAALDALRHYTCKESASVMLDSILKDEKHSVREMALDVYAQHPRRRDITRDKESLILSRNYTYPSVARVKRDIFEKVLLKFRVEVPKFSWSKEIGTKDVGASFGVYFNNYVDALFKVLSGYVDVNAHDKVWAQVHIGLIKKQWDILFVEACYRGRLSYNFNVVKDFTIGAVQDIANAFDVISKRIIEPMEKAANGLAAKLQDPFSSVPMSGFDALAQTVRDLPKMTQEVLQSVVNLAKATELLSGTPLLTKIKQLSARAQSLLEDTHGETTDLYSSIKDAAVVALPFAEKEIRGFINTVLSKLGDVTKAPNQVFSLIERGKMGWGLNNPHEAVFVVLNYIFLMHMLGSRSALMNAGEELREFVETVQYLVDRLKADHRRRKRAADPFDEMTQIIGSSVDEALKNLYSAADSMIKGVEGISQIAKQLQKGFDKLILYTEFLKDNFAEVKEAVDKVKSRVQALFGQKFHSEFPDQRRDCDAECGCGYFTGESRYGHPGIDLMLGPDWAIPSPVAGIISPAGDNSISIDPYTSGFQDYEIILSNIQLNDSLVGQETFVDAGDTIGTPVGRSGCRYSHFHVAMKRKGSDSKSGPSYYVDPTPFLSVPSPIPKWEQECKHFTYKHIKQVIDFDEFSEGFQSLFEELKRAALDAGKNLIMEAVDDLKTKVKDTMKDIAKDIVKDIDLNPGAAKDFFSNIASEKFSISKIADMAKNIAKDNPLAQSLRNVTEIIGQAKDFVRKPSLDKLVTIGTGAVTRLLSSRQRMASDNSGSTDQPNNDDTDFETLADISSSPSSREGMIVALKADARKLCPLIGKALPAAGVSTCMPHDDCLGIDCDVNLSGVSSWLSERIRFSVRMNPEEREVKVTVDGIQHLMTGDVQKTVEGTILGGKIKITARLAAAWEGREVSLSVTLKGCAYGFCTPDIPLMRNNHFIKKEQFVGDLLGPHLGKLESLSLDDVTSMFSDFNFPLNNIVLQVEGVQESISVALTTADGKISVELEQEFKDQEDQKDEGGFPQRGQDGDFSVSFFSFSSTFPVGPVPFTIAFGAGGAFGVEFELGVQAIDSSMTAAFTPWISGKMAADFGIELGIAKAGIQLTGCLLKTTFPLNLRANFNKQPVVSDKSLEVEMIPIELKLHAYLKIRILIATATFKVDIWHWAADPLRGVIWQTEYRKDDEGPPQFKCSFVNGVMSCDGQIGKRDASSTGDACSVTQVEGRHPHDPAFKLEFFAEDDDSDLKLWYAVGDYPGGTNVVGWTEMRGASLLAPAILPCGVPLYFLVRARNSQGLETTGRCSIATYDCTFPDGRADSAYRCSSHSSKLSANVILFEDSELKTDKLFHAVGYSPSSYGHEVVDWLPLTLSNSQPQPGVSGDLRHFNPARPGRLTSTPKKSVKASSASLCASECLKMSTCVSFAYNKHSQSCELQEVTEGARAVRRPDGHFVTYERLGNALTAVLRYERLPLRHGTRYYVNADVQNVLGYRATLTSEGTMVDFTPPEPGDVGEVIKDELSADGCGISILQRCVDHEAFSLNHRVIVDGKGSTTVLNGNRRGQELRYTIENYQASANWDGFKDEECGIYGYAFAVGSTACGSDVASFRDPHASIHNPDDWHHSGLVKDLHLADGPYYVTVQAVNDIIHGGDLVTTVCHSTPFVVDTAPPFMNSVEEILFDETFRFLVVYFNATDVTSGVARTEFGLGRTKYDVMIRRYLPFEMRGGASNTYIVNEEFETEDGVPAWIRLKVVDNVGLSDTGSSDAPIIIDSTAPTEGHVMDGAVLGQDICCQSKTTEICAQWTDFHDPDSSIDRFHWGVGLTPGDDDVVPFHILSAYDKQSCIEVELQHAFTYFSTVVAFNKALNQKSTNTTSNGLLVDVTPPIPGNVSDGDDINNDIDFTSETATITTTWSDFRDPESGLTPYSLSVSINQQLDKVFTDINAETFTDHSFSFQHGDTVVAELTATNRAGGLVSVPSDGMLVDHTPPDLLSISTKNQTQYQQRDDVLHFIWQFKDPESGVAEYRCVIYKLHQGRKSKFWPAVTDFYSIRLNTTSSSHGELHLDGLSLENGAEYSLAVTALNRAKMATAEESNGVTVDTTPPRILKVSLARLGEAEELNDDYQVEQVEGEPLWVTWTPHDTESGIEESQICIGLAGTNDCISTFTRTVKGLLCSTSFDVKDLQVSAGDDRVLYQAYIVVTNGAGVRSGLVASKQFLVLKANVAGVVLDGRRLKDVDFFHDAASIAITFHGFSSEACGIVGYEWGVGTSPFATDILPYSDFGLVVDDHGNGFAQAHITQVERQTYFSTVRAITGHSCHEEYIVSSSDGLTLDTTPPSVTFNMGARQMTSDEVVYQTVGNTLQIAWKAEDDSGVNETVLTLGLFEDNPMKIRVAPVPSEPIVLDTVRQSGDSIYSSIAVSDNAGNDAVLPLPLVTFDFSPPVLVDMKCTDVVSTVASVLACNWLSVKEEHGELSEIKFGLGSGHSVPNLLNFTSVPRHSQRWSVDTDFIISSENVKEIYVIVSVADATGFKTELPIKVTVDVSPPMVDAVRVVTSPRPGYHDEEQQCQTSQDYIEVLLQGLEDTESAVARVELAVGSSRGRSDIKPFREYNSLHGLYIMGDLSLHQRSIVYVTARVTNEVGLSTIQTSEGVAISPEPRLEVWDGPGDTDIDGQAEMNVMQGSWSYSDPCPVLSAEWSLREVGGKMITNFTAILGKTSMFYSDALGLENFKVYVNYVRIRDAMNRTFTAFSDGITISVRQPEPATVRDGLTLADQDFQEATDRLSANWDDFGDSQSSLPSDDIVKYEAAVGTDRRYTTTRANIHTFTDIGLATNVTFYGMNLTAKVVTYFITVRAYSGAGSFIESSSDGIKVGFSADMVPGQVLVDRYQSSVSSVRFSWTDFVSDMVITHYLVGVSTTAPPWDNSTYDCTDLVQNSGFVFDVYTLQVLDGDSLAVVEGVNLRHGSAYHVTVVAEDKMGRCSAAISDEVIVDTTPPFAGHISADGVNAETVIFLHSDQTVVISLEEFPDPESGVRNVEVELYQADSCDPEKQRDSWIPLSKISAVNESRVAMRNLQLHVDTFYFLKATVANGAGLQTTATSRPLMLDTTPPLPGLVKLGTDWAAADRTFQSETHSLRGMIALQSLSSQKDCTTQVNLLSADSKDEWFTMGQEFAEDCVRFETSDLRVSIQHNPYLTGVDKGAAQSKQMTWREGDYVFRLTPATGENVLSGFALHAPSLRPPFLAQNGLLSGQNATSDCDPSVDICLENSNDTASEKPMLTEGDYGMGLSFMEHHGEVKALFWIQDFLQLRQTWIPLGFDPAVTPAEYVLSLQKRMGSGQETWEVTALVNGEAKAGTSGLVFPSEFVVSVYTWNMNDYFPPITDHFQPFEVYTVVSVLSLPVENRPLCSYGTAFQDLLSGIKEIWVGASDGFNSTANVAPHTLVKSFCLPCLKGCSSICSSCSGDSISGDYSVLPVMLSGLLLEAANERFSRTTSSTLDETSLKNSSQKLEEAAEELRQFQLPTYYLDVRVVDHSGLATDTKSVGIVVDTSPPVVKSFYCTDPEYKSDIETMYLGNNHTVGVKWDVYEDITSVQSVSLSVGTQPGLEDIATTVRLRPSAREYVFDNLAPLLVENETYFVTLEVQNEAGLVSQAWSNFTVQTTPPDLSAVTLSLPNVTMTKVGDVDIEWGIGTSDGREDVFPKTVIGTKNAKKVVIVNGFIQVDGFSEDFSVGDYAKQNFTSDTKPDPSANTFEMEPGRCMEQRMYGVSKSHVATAIELPPVCIKRPDDVMLEADDVPHELWISNSTSVDGSPTSADSMRVKVKLSRGAIVAGMLRERDLDVQYGSSASTEFSPFIIHPDPLADPSSRWLRKRLESMPGPKIFLSPVAKAQLSEDVEVTYAVPADVDIPDDSTKGESGKLLKKAARLELCARVFSNSPDSAESRARRRRNAPTSSTASATLGPRMVTMAVVSKTVPNLPPVIQNPFFTMLEDSGLQDFTITYTDDEGDAVVFALARQPAHGTANVTENGLLQYRADPDFSGTDLIYVLGREMLDPRNIALGVIPNTVAFSISAHVTGVNDPPDIIFLPPQNNSAVTCETAGSPTAGWGVNVSVFVEGNTTTLAALGTLLLTDVDQDADFVVSDIVHTDIQKYDVSGTYVMGGKEVALNMTDGYSGHVVYKVRIKDAAAAFSRQLTLNTYVLISPCFHGNCEPRVHTGTCQEPQRAFTFDPYFCKCDLGYEGEWCETETDECKTATCSPITDCVDLIGGYRCDANSTKLVAIILCPIVAVLLGVFAFYKLKKKKSSKVGQWPSWSTLDLKSGISQVTVSARTVSDIDCTAVTEEPGNAMTNKTDTAVVQEVREDPEFFKLPLFTFQPAPNPAASRITTTGLFGVKGQTGDTTKSSTRLAAASSTATPCGAKHGQGRQPRRGIRRLPANNKVSAVEQDTLTKVDT
ncbi:hypothetical protein BaRGS_00011964, partial [Batillaria attramentaria]